MGFTSQINRHEIIIGDEQEYVHFEDYSRGLEQITRGETFGYEGVADPFDEKFLINPSEYQARIQEQEERKQRVSDLIVHDNIPELDQSNTNYCWFYGPLQTMLVMYSKQNEPIPDLCGTSGAARIKGFRNVGGWGKEAVIHLQDKGVNLRKTWPLHKIDRQYDTPAAREEALQYRIHRWVELRPRSMAHLISMLLRGFPVAVGYNWWGHEVMAVEVLWLDGEIALRIRNQWKGWGDRNFGILRGSKMAPDDAVAPVSLLPIAMA